MNLCSWVCREGETCTDDKTSVVVQSRKDNAIEVDSVLESDESTVGFDFEKSLDVPHCSSLPGMVGSCGMSGAGINCTNAHMALQVMQGSVIHSNVYHENFMAVTV